MFCGGYLVAADGPSNAASRIRSGTSRRTACAFDDWSEAPAREPIMREKITAMPARRSPR